MYYEYSRWYDPGIGRFISQDPSAGHVSDPQSLNPYIYVENLPTVLTDPTGAVLCDGNQDCEGGGLLPVQPLTQEQLNSIEDPQIREICGDNPLICRAMGYIQDDQVGGSISTSGGLKAGGPPGSGELGPPTATVVGDTPNIQVDTNVGRGGVRPVELGNQAEGAGLNHLVGEGNSFENIASRERFELQNGRGTIKPDLTVYERGQLTDIVEVKGGSASGTIAETQLTNYNNYAATRGVRLTYIFLREPSRPFLDLLRRYEVRIIPLY